MYSVSCDTYLYFQITDNVLTTVSNIVESDRNIVKKAQSSTILKSLDDMAEKLGDISAAANRTIPIEIQKPNVALAVKYSQIVDFNVVGIQTENEILSLGFKETDNGTVLASAKIPADTFKNKSQIVYSFLFRNDLLFQTGEHKNKNQNQTENDKLSSKILAVSVGKEKIENLASPIQLNFKKTKRISLKDSEVVDNLCTFWYPALCKIPLSDLSNILLKWVRGIYNQCRLSILLQRSFIRDEYWIT